MLELYELSQFVTFADTGTLLQAAKTLHLSQPALSRNMKKLEEELGVTLFERKKNKMELNKNGEYVLALAKKLLEDADALTVKARDYDKKNRMISLGLCAPAPAWFLTPLITNLYSNISLQTELCSENTLLEGLDNDTYQLVVLHARPDSEEYVCKACGHESLMFALPKGHKFSRRKRLSFSDMNGENMLLMPDIGFWSFVFDRMPASRFLTQSDRFSFNELIRASSLPSFTTNLSEKYLESTPSRILVPISDEEAEVTYYLVCKKEKKAYFKRVFNSLDSRKAT